jgi:16S rRNA G1207 methylase RsmC
VTEHYFTADPGATGEPGAVRFRMDARTFELVSDRQVFSGQRLDPGTAVLLREAPSPSGERLLDLGCGYGPIACVLATRLPRAQVWAVDVNARALALARANAAALGLADRVHVCTPEQVPGELTFDEIWSNPPIRIGKPALHALLLHWLPRLAPGGAAWLVVAKNLGSDSLQRWLVEQGFDAVRTTSSRGYRVLQVRHGPR